MREMYSIEDLDLDLIFAANANSAGNVGDVIANSYRFYADAIVGWDIGDEHKRDMLAELHHKYTLMLANEVMTGGKNDSIGTFLRNKEHQQGIFRARSRCVYG